ncbi:P450 reductase [Cystobasidium minutum MCA 4210]|uniref:P450 reductase n=1 Tax=Cystobasidium minutum MCA 4210 TaxID=1397322 RepID=UPI0034CFE2C8|eukprot:jgi/Rhomi1/183057/fgenesh1_pm.2_\
MEFSTSDYVLLALVGLGAFYYLFKDSLFGSGNASPRNLNGNGSTYGGNTGKVGPASADGAGTGGNSIQAAGRDIAKALKITNKRIAVIYGSQTGTAEDYALRIAKEIKQKFGLSSLVLDPEDYDYDTLDQIPNDCAVIFVMATYGEGEPTDNAVALMDFLKEPNFESGATSLDNLNYVVDSLLSNMGAKRVGERGEGDDDKSMEEDYLGWKDGMLAALQEELKLEEGAGGDVSDFKVTELGPADEKDNKVYLGELSQRALTGSRGIFDAKNPYPAPLLSSRELFLAGDRNCVFAEFGIKDTGVRYQTGDHVGVWPMNPETEVERILRVLGLQDKRNTVIEVTSLDPALAKVPFPTPTTIEAVLRHYLDINAVANRQACGALARWAPEGSAAREKLERWGSDKEAYHNEVAEPCLKLSEVLLAANGEEPRADPMDPASKITAWNIPFDRIISLVPRLQPRYYSISSSPKLYPDSIHVTAVVLKYRPGEDGNKQVAQDAKYVFGTATNYLLNVKMHQHNEKARIEQQGQTTHHEDTRDHGSPQYKLDGPRNKFKSADGGYCVPIHVRRSNFRLPTSPKIPVVMIGPGTGVAPFRGFIQERVALARKAIAKDGLDALKDWGDITLFYGCRHPEVDYLYQEEFAEYEKELGGKFKLFVAFSRVPGQKKTYVQHMISEQRELIKQTLVEKKGYAYICGDAKNMARDVEELLKEILAEAKGGTKQKEGEAEYKMLKERNRLLLDVWS